MLRFDYIPTWSVAAVLLMGAGCGVAIAGTSVLVCDNGNAAVRAYDVNGTNWVYTGIFASGLYGGQPLTAPLGVAQDAAQRIYIGEATATGRILRFDTNGVYLGAIGTNGVQFAGSVPQTLVIGPDGNLYVSFSFGTTASNCVYRYHIANQAWSVFIPNSGTGYTLNNPRGMAFASDGNLYVADRQNNVIRKFHGTSGAFLGNIAVTAPTSGAFPQGLSWDAANNRLLATMTSVSDIYAYTLAGSATKLYSGSEYCLDVKAVDGQVAFTRYTSGRADLVHGTTSALPVATFLKNPGHLQPVTLAPREPVEPPGCPPLPGTAIKYTPASSGLYLGSPAIQILPNGDYLASHDYFGPGSSQTTLGQTFLYRSGDRGTNWALLGQINQLVSGNADTNGHFWNHFIALNGALYAIGNRSSGSGNYMVIRRSTDQGQQWTSVEPAPGYSGHLFPGTNWGPGHTFVIQQGRIWLEADRGRGTGIFGDNIVGAISAPTNSNLLDPASWSVSTTVVRDTSWLGGTFVGWLEGNALEDRQGGLVLMMRVDNRYANGAAIGGKAALIRVNPASGTNATAGFSGGVFDPNDPNSSGFVDFPGGCTRFTVRFDPVSERYWTLCNYIPRKFRTNAYNAERFRGILVLASSPDLKDWRVERIVMADWRLYSEDPAVVATAFDGNQTDYGFQYADWQFDGDDLAATVRTGFCDQFGGSDNGHNANYYLFRRVENFRVNAGSDTVRITRFQPPDADGVVRVHFATRPARLYQVESSVDLVTWQDAGVAAFEGYGSEGGFNLAAQPQTGCFYRIRESASWLP
jgi:hypothetical protein